MKRFFRCVTEKAAKEKDARPPAPEDELVPSYLIDRWLKELSNRRQYLGFLRTLQVRTDALRYADNRSYKLV
jgi:hypothetical protein